MLLNNFYTIQKSSLIEDNKWRFIINLNPDHIIYQGHFPDNPILPGVCMIQIIKDCAIEILKFPLRYEQISSCKFLSIVSPLDSTSLYFDLSFKEISPSEIDLRAEGKDKDRVFIKIKSVLSKL